MRKKTGEFIKQKKTIRKLVILAGLLFMVLVHILLFNVFTGNALTFSQAASSINFSQEIQPINPVQEVDNATEIKSDKPDIRSSRFRVLSNVDSLEEKGGKKETRYIAKSPIITLRGKAIYPRAEIILEIHSAAFLTSVKSDDQGNWSWTNYGHPLENGEHSIKIYSFSPFDLSGKRDVFVEKYFFVMDSISEASETDTIFLDESTYVEKLGDDDIGDKIILGNVSDVYVFDITLLNKKDYYSGDQLLLQMTFNPLGENASGKADLKYEIYYFGDNENNPQLVSQFEDNRLPILDGGSFLKKVTLKNDAMSGGYFIKIAADLSGKNYVQAVKFYVGSKKVIQVGDTAVTKEKLAKMLVWDVVVLLVVALIIIIAIIMEFKRFLIYRPINERTLKRKNYFAK